MGVNGRLELEIQRIQENQDLSERFIVLRGAFHIQVVCPGHFLTWLR